MFCYETLSEVHWTKFCGVLEPPLASEKWRTTTCIIHKRRKLARDRKTVARLVE